MVATPDLTLTVTPPGGAPVDYSDYLAWSGTQQTPSITQNFGRQGDTAQLVLAEEFTSAPSVIVPVMSQINLRDNIAGQTLFAGLVNDPVLLPTAPNRNEWTLNCTDYTVYADNALVHGIYYGWTVDRIVVDLTQKAQCGIKAARIADGGYVAPGPQLASYVQNYNQLSTAWKTLAGLAGSATPYGWYVDEGMNLHFYDASTAISSGVTFTTTPTAAGGSLTEGHMMQDSQNAYEWDGTSLYNRILVQGANQTIPYGTVKSPPTDTWVGDGYQQSWPLRYTVTGSPILHIGGKTTTVDVVQAGSTSTSTWQITQNSVGAWFLTTTGTAPGRGVVINVWYDYSVPVVAQANDYPSQQEFAGPNGGVFAEFISDSTLTTVPMALARAMQQRQEYAFPVERTTFNSSPEWLGWVRAGQTCRIINGLVPDARNGYRMGVDDTFLVTANSVQFGAGGYRQCQITAIRL
jgi:hypothetical protein